jgi:hypothetical protein
MENPFKGTKIHHRGHWRQQMKHIFDELEKDCPSEMKEKLKLARVRMYNITRDCCESMHDHVKQIHDHIVHGSGGNSDSDNEDEGDDSSSQSGSSDQGEGSEMGDSDDGAESWEEDSSSHSGHEDHEESESSW